MEIKHAIFDKQDWAAQAQKRGFTVLHDHCHKGNATAYKGNRTVGSWSVNKGEGYLIY